MAEVFGPAFTEPCRARLLAGFGYTHLICIWAVARQHGVAAIPAGLYKDWRGFRVAFTGTVLAQIAGLLPRQKVGKLASRRNSYKNFALISGNGVRDVMIVMGDGNSLDLEELAAAETPRCQECGGHFQTSLLR